MLRTNDVQKNFGFTLVSSSNFERLAPLVSAMYAILHKVLSSTWKIIEFAYFCADFPSQLIWEFASDYSYVRVYELCDHALYAEQRSNNSNNNMELTYCSQTIYL